MCLHYNEEGGNTGSTHILLGVFVSACQSRLLSRPVVQDAGWHRSTILCDFTTYHGIQFINSLRGLMVEELFGTHVRCHEVEFGRMVVNVIDSQVEIWTNTSPVQFHQLHCLLISV